MDKHMVIIKTVLILPELWWILFYGQLSFTQNMLFYMNIKNHEQVVQNSNRITWESEAGLWIQGPLGWHKWDCLKQNKIHT